MITKVQIEERTKKILRELNSVYANLERVWDAAREHDYEKVMREVDNIQNLGRGTISGAKFQVEQLREDLEELLEQQEKIKDLPKLLDLQMAFDQIRSTVKRWDKQLYPEDHKQD